MATSTSSTPLRPQRSSSASPVTIAHIPYPSSSSSTPHPPVKPSTPRQQSTLSSAGSEKRRARRADLRSFYGIKPSTPLLEEGSNSRTGGVSGSNSKFDSEGYYDDLVGKSNLVELIKAASSLGVDIAELQGERHALVYNHHHQVCITRYVFLVVSWLMGK
jgi:hypothetical protein